jgi:hypothetical protein
MRDATAFSYSSATPITEKQKDLLFATCHLFATDALDPRHKIQEVDTLLHGKLYISISLSLVLK